MTTFLNTAELAELAGLNAGRNPQWPAAESLALAASNPPGPSDGVSVAGSTLALVAVDLRRDARYGGAIVRITAASAGTYTVTLDGDAYTYIAGSGEGADDILAGLYQETVASSHTGTLLDLDGDGVNDALSVVRGNGVAIATATVSGSLTATLDATQVEFAIWMRPTGSARWRSVTSQVVDRNWLDLLRTSGIDRVYVQALVTDGALSWTVAPCAVTAAG